MTDANADDARLTTELYAHYLATFNWAVFTATFALGLFFFNTYIPYMVLVALVGITLGNFYIYMNRRNRSRAGKHTVANDPSERDGADLEDEDGDEEETDG